MGQRGGNGTPFGIMGFVSMRVPLTLACAAYETREEYVI
jgi:hypothetical protein